MKELNVYINVYFWTGVFVFARDQKTQDLLCARQVSIAYTLAQQL